MSKGGAYIGNRGTVYIQGVFLQDKVVSDKTAVLNVYRSVIGGLEVNGPTQLSVTDSVVAQQEIGSLRGRYDFLKLVPDEFIAEAAEAVGAAGPGGKTDALKTTRLWSVLKAIRDLETPKIARLVIDLARLWELLSGQ